MIVMLPVKEIEEFVKENVTDTLITHDFSHFKRVSIGARWFVTILKGTKEEETLAYIAGLLHDCVRPDTEKVCHAVASTEKARKILNNFNIDPESIERIAQAIRDHRKPVKWTSPLHQSVYLADKTLESMGHYVTFRRCVYVGECRDYNGKPFEQSIENYLEYRLKKFDFTKFPLVFQPLVKEMFRPAIGFHEIFKRREDWSLRLARFCYDKGRDKSATMDEIIRNFSPDSEEAKTFKIESLKYIEGRKFDYFKKLVNQSKQTEEVKE